MKHALRLPLFILMSITLLVPAAFAAPAKKYASQEHGFSLRYPADWHIQEGSDDVQMSTTENAYESGEPGAGVSVMVKEAKAADSGDPKKTLARVLEDTAAGYEFGAESVRAIGGRDWYAAAFTAPEENIEGDVYVLVRGVRVFVIGRYFKQSGARDAFAAETDALIGSFAFAERKLKTFTDQKRGISFRHPDQARIEAQDESIMVYIEGDNPDEDSAGVAFTLGIIDAAAEGMKDLDEKGLIETLKGMADGDDDLAVISENEPVTVMKTTWYKSVFRMAQGQITFVVRRYGAHFAAAVFLVSPPAAAAEYEKAFDIFLGSISFDVKKWTASLNRKE